MSFRSGFYLCGFRSLGGLMNPQLYQILRGIPPHQRICGPVTCIPRDQKSIFAAASDRRTFESCGQETSRATGQENYVEVYVSAEANIKIPIVEKIVTFDMKGGVKTGEKHYARHEERRASRQAQQLSRTFNLTKLGRNCLLYSPGIVNKPVVNPVVVQTGMNWNRRTPRRSVPFGMRMTCQQTRFISAMRKQPKRCNV